MGKYTVAFATQHFATDVAGMLQTVIGDEVSLDVCMASPGNKYDLLVFTGGADIDPRFYGEENYHSYCTPSRDIWERELFNRAPASQKFLGICRGHQLLNAFFGGKLTQHIQKPHPSCHPLSNGWHVNSLHHQGVISVEYGTENLAMFQDEIEITRMPGRFLSFQFHPEFCLPDPEKEFTEMLLSFLLEE